MPTSPTNKPCSSWVPGWILPSLSFHSPPPCSWQGEPSFSSSNVPVSVQPFALLFFLPGMLLSISDLNSHIFFSLKTSSFLSFRWYLSDTSSVKPALTTLCMFGIPDCSLPQPLFVSFTDLSQFTINLYIKSLSGMSPLLEYKLRRA